MAECRRCGEDIRWSRTTNGVMMPVQPDGAGEYVLLDEGDSHPTARWYDAATHRGLERYTRHADLCAG